MVVQPPSDSVNADGKSVFFDSVHIKPQKIDQRGNPMPVLTISGSKEDDEYMISVSDLKATMINDTATPVFSMPRKEGMRIGFNRIGFRYEPQIFSSRYEHKYVQVAPYSTVKAKTSIVQTNSIAKFMATFTVETVHSGLIKFQLAGSLTYT